MDLKQLEEMRARLEASALRMEDVEKICRLLEVEMPDIEQLKERAAEIDNMTVEEATHHTKGRLAQVLGLKLAIAVCESYKWEPLLYYQDPANKDAGFEHELYPLARQILDVARLGSVGREIINALNKKMEEADYEDLTLQLTNKSQEEVKAILKERVGSSTD